MCTDNDHFRGASADKSTAAIKGFHSPLQLRGAAVDFYFDLDLAASVGEDICLQRSVQG